MKPLHDWELGRGTLKNLWRLVRYGPALYRASRRLGASRRHALFLALFP